MGDKIGVSKRHWAGHKALSDFLKNKIYEDDCEHKWRINMGWFILNYMERKVTINIVLNCSRCQKTKDIEIKRKFNPDNIKDVINEVREKLKENIVGGIYV